MDFRGHLLDRLLGMELPTKCLRLETEFYFVRLPAAMRLVYRLSTRYYSGWLTVMALHHLAFWLLGNARLSH